MGRTSTLVVALSGLVMACGSAQQQVQSPEPPVNVKLVSAEPDLRLTMYPWGEPQSYEHVALRCRAPCDANVTPGNYRLFVQGPPDSDVRKSNRQISISGPVAFEVDPPSERYRNIGRGMGIMGPVAMVVGMMLVVQGSPASGDSSEKRQLVGGLLLGGGAVITATGWTIFAMNGPPTVEPIIPGR